MYNVKFNEGQKQCCTINVMYTYLNTYIQNEIAFSRTVFINVQNVHMPIMILVFKMLLLT